MFELQSLRRYRNFIGIDLEELLSNSFFFVNYITKEIKFLNEFSKDYNDRIPDLKTEKKVKKIILAYSPNIFICVSSFNQKAYQLYTSLGFEKVGELPNFVKQGFTEILLRKTRGPLVGYIPQ